LVANHESGTRRLTSDEYDTATRQLHNYQRKLEHMEQTNDVVSTTIEKGWW
jgi:hypothetical protein